MTYEEEYFINNYIQKQKAMNENKFTLATETQIDKDSVYLVDWSKLKSIDEMILLLASIGFSFSPTHPQFSAIKHLLALDRPIKIGNSNSVKEAQEKKIELPKLKKI